MLSFADCICGLHQVPLPIVSLESWLGQILSVVLPAARLAMWRRAQRRRLLVGHALSCTLSSHRIRHSFEDLESCEMLERGYRKRRLKVPNWNYVFQRDRGGDVGQPALPPIKVLPQLRKRQLKDRGRDSRGSTCSTACDRTGMDGELAMCASSPQVSSGERMRRSSLSSPKARPLRPFPLDAISLEDDDGGVRACRLPVAVMAWVKLRNGWESGDHCLCYGSLGTSPDMGL